MLIPAFDAAPASARQDTVSILQSASAYVADYEHKLSSVIAAEHYVQQAWSGGTMVQARDLKSDYFVADLPDGGWTGFRDVYSVDGKPVRDQRDRLSALFLHPSPDAMAQARRIADESARFNIGNIARTLNTPTLALTFLRQDMQPRSVFTVTDHRTIDGSVVLVVSFHENSRPRVVHTFDDAPAHGVFWIDQSSGRVRRSTMSIESAGATADVAVVYGPQPKLTVWVPISMDEQYRWRTPGAAGSSSIGGSSGRADADAVAAGPEPPQRIDGHAAYSDFRVATVTTVVR